MSPTAPAVLIHDPTLRDGHHAVRHQLDQGQLRDYAAAADLAGVPVVEVGHGNGLGASSLQIGRAALSDAEMLSTVRDALQRARMAVFMGPGWGTCEDLRGAFRYGAQVFRIAAHCTEADVTERHLGFVAEHGGEGQGVLMMSHMASPAQLAEQCALMVRFGAQAVGIFDSAGHFLPEDVQARIAAISEAVDVPVIFHGHNNLGMAIANSVAAVRTGARIIDACARGFGAGAGNTQLEVLVAVLERLGHPTGIDLNKVLAAADVAERRLMSAPPFIDSVAVMSGRAGVFSGFKTRVLEIAAREGISPGDLFDELGRRQVIAGQEDLIPEAAHRLKEKAVTEHPTTTAGLDPDVEDLLVRELRVKPEALAADATLEEAGLDSLSLVELSVLLSELLGSKVSEDEIHDARTVGGLAVLVENKRRGR